MKKIKINICYTCRKIYDTPKIEHCKAHNCKREHQAVLECDPVLFWGRIADVVKGFKRDIYGVARRAEARTAIPKVKDAALPNPKTFNGAITE